MLVQSGATLDLNNFNQTLGSLSGAGNITLGSATLTAGADNTSTVASGAISGTGGLAKIGTGSLTLTGANTYSGGTTVSGGALIGTSTSLQGDILNNATVEFDQGSSGTYAGSMTGGGALTKRGSGTLALTGANTYSGGTTIAGGVLIGTSASLQGDIRNNASLVFDQAASGTYAGVISGSGTFTKSGAGTLTLSRSSTFTGGASIAGGVLRAGTANVFGAATAVGVASGATFDLNNFSQTLKSVSGGGNIALGSATLTTGGSNASAVLSGVISGTGSLVKTGGGTLALTGANTYSGGTRVSGGILLGNSTSLQGGILDDARVVFDQAFDGTFSGSIAGSGILEKAGGGTLTLAGTDTHTGGTLISGGSLVVTAANLSGFVQNDGGLIFGGGADGVFSGTLGGTGSLNKRGTGTLTLNGYHIFSGLTTVAEGTLALNGVLDGNVTVAPGATFRANGTVFRNVDLSGRLSVQSGVVLPAGPATDVSLEASAGAALPPALTIGGNLVARPNSVLELSLAPGTDPLLLVGGVATLDGTRVDATLIDLGTQRNVSFLALSALKGLTVTDTTVAVQDPLLATMLTQRDTSLFVTVLNLGVPLASAVSPNLASVAGAVDTLKADMTGDRGFVVRELLALDDAELNGAMQAIAGELHASNRHVVIRSAESFTDLIRSEMTDRDHEAGAGQPGWGGRKVRWFGQLSRQHAAFDSRGGAAGGGFDVSDGVGGFEYKVSDRVLVGGGAGFGFGSMSLGGLSASSDLTTPRAFGIVGFKPLGFSLRAGGSFSRSKATSKRRIVIIATLPAEFGGGPLSAGIDREALSEEVTVQNDQWSEYADNFDIKTYTLDFMFGLRRARFSRDAFLETGAGALSLRSRGDTISLTDVDAKIHFRRREGNMRPYVEALVRHSSGFRYKLPVEFAADENSDFEAAGLPMGRNAFAGRAGVWFDRRIGTFILEYRIRVASGQTVQTGGLRFRF